MTGSLLTATNDFSTSFAPSPNPIAIRSWSCTALFQSCHAAGPQSAYKQIQLLAVPCKILPPFIRFSDTPATFTALRRQKCCIRSIACGVQAKTKSTFIFTDEIVLKMYLRTSFLLTVTLRTIIPPSVQISLRSSDLPMTLLGTAVAQWLRCCATNRNVVGSIPAGVTGISHWHKILPIALWPWGRLSLYLKWELGAFPAGKGGRCVKLTTLPPSCAIVMKSGNLNFLEPSGPLQACNETALHIPINLFLHDDDILMILTYLLTPWCRVLLEKLTGFQLVKKFPAFYGTPKVHYRSHKCPPPVPILNKINSIHTLIPFPEDPS